MTLKKKFVTSYSRTIKRSYCNHWVLFVKFLNTIFETYAIVSDNRSYEVGNVVDKVSHISIHFSLVAFTTDN